MSGPHAELRDLIATVFQQMGGRATKGDVLGHLRIALPEELADYCTERGLSAAVNGFFRAQSADGLPQAPAVDEHGTHVQLSLLDVDEYRYVIAKYMAAAGANRAQAFKAQALCFERHGVLVDLDDPWAEDVA